jgi:addiction module toxin, RelE/StbE family
VLKVELSRQAAKFLKSLPPKQGRQLAVKIVQLRKDPHPHDSIPMKGKVAGYRRTHVGEYRIIYRVEGDTLQVVLVGKRNDQEIYRQLTRK